LKRFDQLSAGQQYRAMLARMISSGSNLWAADEFCVNLDPVAANCVATRLRRLAKKLGAALIVATPHPETVAHSLKPDLVVRLTTAWENEVLPGREFLRRLGKKAVSYKVPTLKVSRDILQKIGRGHAAIFVGGEEVLIEKGPLMLTCGRSILPGTATKPIRMKLRDVSLSQLRATGDLGHWLRRQL
jgi:hypothetical protein